MKIEMTEREFQELFKFIKLLDNPKIKKSFNEIFSNAPTGGVKGYVEIKKDNDTVISKDVVVEVPENLTYEIEKVFVLNGAELGKLLKSCIGGGISLSTFTPKRMTMFKKMYNDIVDAITSR